MFLPNGKRCNVCIFWRDITEKDFLTKKLKEKVHLNCSHSVMIWIVFLLAIFAQKLTARSNSAADVYQKIMAIDEVILMRVKRNVQPELIYLTVFNEKLFT